MAVAAVRVIDQVFRWPDLHGEIVLTVPPEGVAAGNSILVQVAFTNLFFWPAGEATGSDAAGNAYTVDLDTGPGGDGAPRVLWLSAHDALPLVAGDAITVTFENASLTYSEALALEVRGLTGAVEYAQGDDGTGTAPSSGATPVASQRNVFAFGAVAAGVDLDEFTPTGAWTELAPASSFENQSSGHTLFPLYQVLTAADAVEAAGILSHSRLWTAGVVTYLGDLLTMADPVGNLAKVGIGIEGTAGTPVKAQVLLDAVSENIKGEGAPIRSKAFNGTRMVKKVVAGTYQWGGDIQLEVTPDKFPKLLYAALTAHAAPATAAPYTHTLKTGANLKPLTVHVYRPGPDGATEPCFFVYPGGYVEILEFRQSAEEILMATATLQGRAGEKIFDAAQEDVGIAFSAFDPFVFHQLVVTIDGAPSVITSDWSLRINTGLITQRNLAGGRVPNRMFAGDSLISGSFQLMFESISEHRKFLGAAADTSPIDIGTAVNTVPLTLEWTQTAQRKLTLACGEIYYRASGPAVAGRDQTIVQPIEWEAKYDGDDASDIVCTIVNGESGTIVTGAGTDIS